MWFKAFLPLVFALTAVWLSPAKAQSPEDSFKQGTAAFQKADLDQARAKFREALQVDENNPVTLYNLGLVEQRTGRNGLAIALWRKALAISPQDAQKDEQTRAAIAWTQTKLERTDLPHEMELWESLRNVALSPISLEKYLPVTALLLLSTGWLILRYVGARRRALLEEKPLPSPPWIAIVSGLFLTIATVLTAAKMLDLQMIRGTIIEKKIAANSTPDSAGTPLFDLYEGLEVILRTRSGDWVQVTYPGGPTGWIPKKAVFATTDKVAP